MKRICKVYSLNDRNTIQNELNNHNIISKSKSKGVSAFVKVTDKVIWFIIYVDKSDYESAKSVINEMSKGNFEKEIEMY